MPKGVLKNIFLSLLVISLLSLAGWLYMSRSPGSPTGTGDSPSTYIHTGPDFKFDRPEGFGVSGFEDGEGETILVQKDGKGFQIFLSVLDEELEVTAERIKQDIPDIVFENPKQIEIDGAPALYFESKDDAGLATQEIWFAKGQNLYQITSYPEFSSSLKEVTESWEWQ